ncbi:nucleoside hydrolase [Phytohabitans sp. ZYX-F-186]|uniref:Nucleoside hydrolase n=1 Tax=Phytohabitans maris TaxID=3071409 RepID=A0ABU0ZG21_9ACTN|nr:nucleoside hydrolase [Phytohabitans sp. ZYX-F-186]MDQ7906016.1 nucleoside hydrolase [Phytohabitans sp. ZYX-F-186]
MPEKILLDTDIGSDIDDAVCLAYLLAHPGCDLLGITTVTGEAGKRAMLASALCRVAGADVPIRPGAETTLAGAPSPQALAHQADRLGGWPHETEFPAGDAVDLLARTVRAHPGEVTLLTIGPLTNAALLFDRHPDVAGLLKALVLMGGRYTTEGKPEWNLRCDPAAAARVFAAPVPRVRAVGLDVTRQVYLDADTFSARCAAPLLRPVRDFAAVWFAERDGIYFHDPLAAVTLFDAEVCAFTRGEVTVDADGTTGWHPRPDGPHEVATSVVPDRFFTEYFARF